MYHNRNSLTWEDYGPKSRVIPNKDGYDGRDHFVYFEDGTYAVRSRPLQKAKLQSVFEDPFWKPQLAPIPKRGDRYWDDVATNGSERGTASLNDTAMLVLLKHPHLLSAEALENVPWIIGRQLWQRIIATSGITLNIWQIFNKAYAKEQDLPHSLLSFDQSLSPSSYSKLNLYLKKLNSPSCAWVTSVNLQHMIVSRSSIVKHLPELDNLVMAEFRNVFFEDGSPFDDRICQKWTHSVRLGKFKFLQMLGFYHQERISTRVVSFVNEFPSLWLVIVGGINLAQQRMPTYVDPQKRWTHNSPHSRAVVTFLKQPNRTPCSEWPTTDIWEDLKLFRHEDNAVGIPDTYTPSTLSMSSSRLNYLPPFVAGAGIDSTTLWLQKCHCVWQPRQVEDFDDYLVNHPHIKVYTKTPRKQAPTTTLQTSTSAAVKDGSSKLSKKRKADGQGSGRRPVKRQQEGLSMLQAFGIL